MYVAKISNTLILFIGCDTDEKMFDIISDKLLPVQDNPIVTVSQSTVAYCLLAV